MVWGAKAEYMVAHHNSHGKHIVHPSVISWLITAPHPPELGGHLSLPVDGD